MPDLPEAVEWLFCMKAICRDEDVRLLRPWVQETMSDARAQRRAVTITLHVINAVTICVKISTWASEMAIQPVGWLAATSRWA
jgi:hypothetical protein